MTGWQDLSLSVLLRFLVQSDCRLRLERPCGNTPYLQVLKPVSCRSGARNQTKTRSHLSVLAVGKQA